MNKKYRPEEGKNNNKSGSKTPGNLKRGEGGKKYDNRRSRNFSENENRENTGNPPRKKNNPKFFQPKDSESNSFKNKRDKSAGEENSYNSNREKGQKKSYNKFEEKSNNPKFLQPKDKEIRRGSGFRNKGPKESYRSESGTSNRKYRTSDAGQGTRDKRYSKTDKSEKSKSSEFSERPGNLKKNFNKRDNSRYSKAKETDNRKPEVRVNPGEIRLNRYIANAGVCSRRDADLLIKAGEITVNGKVITEMGYKVQPGDVVRHNNKKLQREKLVYLLLNKPKDFITTTEDPENRKTIMNLVESAGSERIYPVGRLDRNTTGLIILTNDGELADKLSHPSNNIKKLYQVDLDKPISNDDLIKIKEGVMLEDGLAEVDEIAVVSTDAKSLGLQIHSGKNRIVRRIFEHLGYDVVKLDRVMYAGLDKKDLPRGKWRFLSEKEVIRLKYLK